MKNQSKILKYPIMLVLYILNVFHMMTSAFFVFKAVLLARWAGIMKQSSPIWSQGIGKESN